MINDSTPGNSGGAAPHGEGLTQRLARVIASAEESLRLIQDPNNQWLQLVAEFCCIFTKRIHYESAIELANMSTEEQLAFLEQHFLPTITEEKIRIMSGTDHGPTFGQLSNLALYLQLEAIKRWRSGDDYHPGHPALYRVTYDILLGYVGAEVAYEVEQNEKERDAYLSLRANFPLFSPKSANPNLSPDEKARLLRNAVEALNKIGHMTFQNNLCLVHHDCASCDYEAMRTAKKFFARRRDLSVEQVFFVLEQCVEKWFDPMRPGSNEYDEHWHARRGWDVGFLLSNFGKVVQQLGLAELLPELADPDTE